MSIQLPQNRSDRLYPVADLQRGMSKLLMETKPLIGAVRVQLSEQKNELARNIGVALSIHSADDLRRFPAILLFLDILNVRSRYLLGEYANPS